MLAHICAKQITNRTTLDNTKNYYIIRHFFEDRGWIMHMNSDKMLLQNRSLRLKLIIFIILIISSSFFQNRLVNASLLAFYQFEGNSNDSSGNGNSGTVNGATVTGTGFQGSAFQFDGVDDFIEIPVNINPSVLPQITMGAWVNADVANNVIRQIISHDDAGWDRSLGMDTRSGGGDIPDWSSFKGDGVLISGIDVTVGEWVFLAVVYDQTLSTVRLHVNNAIFLDSATLGSGWPTARIGSNPSFGEFFEGRIDNVFIFNEALDISRIEEIRNNPSSILPTSGTCPKDGDVDLDGAITIDDVLLAFNAIFDPSTLTSCQRDHADIDDDGSITINDVICIFNTIFGIPCGPVTGRTDNDSPTLDRIDVTRTILSHGRVDTVRPISFANPGGLRQVPGFGDPDVGIAGLLTTIAGQVNPLRITLDDDGDGEPNIDNVIVLAGVDLPSCFTLAVAEELNDPDGDPVGVRWEAPNPRFGAGNAYATVNIPNADPEIDIFAGMELVTFDQFDAYTANSIIWEAPDVGFVIVDSELDGGTENIAGKAIDFPPAPLNSKMSPLRSRLVGFADPLGVNIVEGCKGKNSDGSFRLELVAVMPNNFDPLIDTTFRWAFEGKTVTIVKDISASSLVEFNNLPEEEAGTLARITVVASSKGPGSSVNPFVQQPPEQSVGNDTFISVGCTLSDTESVSLSESVEEKCDDGVDNDCDGEIDEGCNFRLFVDDNQCEDDTIGVEVDGINLGETPRGKGRFFDIDQFSSGVHTLTINPLSSGGAQFGCAANPIVSYGVSLLGGLEFITKNGAPFTGTGDSGEISVGSPVTYTINIP